MKRTAAVLCIFLLLGGGRPATLAGETWKPVKDLAGEDFEVKLKESTCIISEDSQTRLGELFQSKATDGNNGGWATELVHGYCRQLAVTGDESKALALLELEIGDDVVDLPSSYGFVNLQEYSGRRNVTRHWLSALQTDRSPELHVDNDSVVVIRFDLDRLLNSGNTFWTEGQLSLAATNNAAPIEVQGYSEIGQQRTAVGPTGLPPHRFLLNLHQFQVLLVEFIRTHRGRYGTELCKENTAATSAAEPDRPEDQIGTPPPEGFEMAVELLRKFLEEFFQDESTYTAFFTALDASPTFLQERRERLTKTVAELKTKRQEAATKRLDKAKFKQLRRAYSEKYTAYQKVLNDLDKLEADARVDTDKLNSEIQYLEKQKAALAVDADPTSLIDQIATKRQARADRDSRLRRDTEALTATHDAAYEEFLDATDNLQEATASGDELTNLYNKRLFREVVELERVLNQSARPTPAYPDDGLDPCKSDSTFESEMKWIVTFWEQRDELGVKRQQRAFREIYRNLVPGRIDLRKSGVRPGDVVNVELLLTQPGKNKATGRTLATLIVGDYGWKTSAVDSFLLVKRKRDRDAGPDANPSNFKGAAGMSLLWSHEKRPDVASWWSRNGSYGINVSYLDFDTTKDLEVGAGGVIGLFRNRMHLGVGANLNVSGGWDQRGYYFVGFSFGTIAAKLTGKGGKAKTRNASRPASN